MRKLMLAAGSVCLLLTVWVVPAASQNAPALSVTAEEQAVYEAVLDSWLGTEETAQRINEHLAPAPSTSAPSNAECIAGLSFEKPRSAGNGEKTLAGVKFSHPGLQVVDGDNWQPDDPIYHITNGNDVAPAVRQAMDLSLITLSQITFSKNRQDALVEFSMICGAECGTGSTLRLHKAHDRWAVIKRCGGFMA